MSTSTIYPRPDQILELSRGIQLPIPEVHAAHLEIIAETFARAFKDVQNHRCKTVASGSEAEVTALLEARLNNMIENDPLWGPMVHCVVRGKESISIDGSHLEKRPDLSIYLTDRNRNFPLITEAKIVDESTDKTEKLYCENGLCRFLNGEYAWGTREAFMLAYVRDGSTIEKKLTPFLSNAHAQNPAKYSVEKLPTQYKNASIDLAKSKHGRSFIYTNQAPSTDLPGPIDIWHLWVK